jgi:signal transduction histidine kinase
MRKTGPLAIARAATDVRLLFAEEQPVLLDLLAQDISLAEFARYVCLSLERVLPDAAAMAFQLDAETARLDCIAAPSLPRDMVVDLQSANGAGFCSAIVTGGFLVASDLPKDPLWPVMGRAASANDLRTCWSAPVADHRGYPIACFGVWFGTVRRPDDEERALLEDVARLLRIAIQRDRAAGRLAEARQTIRSFAAHLPCCAYSCIEPRRGRARYTFISDGVWALFGLTPEQVMADPFAMLNRIPEPERSRHVENLRLAKRNLGSHAFEVPVDLPGGERRWLRTYSNVRRAGDGTTFWDGAVFDITETVHALAAARMHETRLRDAIESVSEGFALFTEDWRLVLSNRRFAEMYPEAADIIAPGMILRDLLQRRIRAGLVRLDGRSEDELLESILQSYDGSSHRIVERMSTNGRVHRISSSRTSDGGYVSVHFDVTEQRHAEAEARRQATIVEKTLDNVDQGLVLYDESACLLYANAKVSQMIGLPRDRIVPGMSFDDLFWQSAEARGVSRSEAEASLADTRYALQRRAVYGSVRVQPDGRRIEVHYLPMADGGFLGTISDVTERDRMMEALTASEARLRDAVDNMAEGFALWDDSNRLVLWNRRYEEMYPHIAPLLRVGASFVELRRHDVGDLPVSVEHSIPDANSALDVGLQAEVALSERQYADGRTYQIRRHRTARGNLVAVHLDVTDTRKRQRKLEKLAVELERARDDAEAANRVKSEFLANMSHELRTPLNAIIGFSEVMKGAMLGPLGNSQYRDYAEHIVSSGRHLLSIVNSILDLSKIEAGRQDLNEDAVDLAEMARICVNLVADRARVGEITIRCDDLSDLPDLRADALRVRQLLLNLLSNAVKFTPPKGEVRLSGRRLPTGGIALSVSDTGIGMDAAELKVALEPFRQIENSFIKKFEGAGLGLPLAKALVELHGGTLDLESRKGQGTTVTATFPPERVV